MESIKKLSIAKCSGKMTAKRVIEAGGKLPVLRVVGMAVGVKSGRSDYGDWTALIGDFGVTNLVDGEQFRGSTLFLPDVGLTPIHAQIAAGARGVQFAMDVFANEDESSPVGYSYTVEHLVKAEDDLISRLMASANDVKPLALPGAAAAAAPTNIEDAKAAKSKKKAA